MTEQHPFDEEWARVALVEAMELLRERASEARGGRMRHLDRCANTLDALRAALPELAEGESKSD